MNQKKKTSQTIFITGAATGIGLATAKLLLSQGYNVAIFSLTKPDIHDMEILSAIPHALVLTGNICNAMHVQKALSATIEKFGSLDVLINNAGISQKKLFKDSTAQEWDFIINVNIKGTLIVTQCALLYIHKGGLIINISSGSALHAVSHLSLYSLTKAALLNFTQSLDKEVQKDGIRVVVVTPGSTQTALFEKASPGKTPFYQPEDIAQVIVNTVSGKQKPDKNRIVNPFKHLYR